MVKVAEVRSELQERWGFSDRNEQLEENKSEGKQRPWQYPLPVLGAVSNYHSEEIYESTLTIDAKECFLPFCLPPFFIPKEVQERPSSHILSYYTIKRLCTKSFHYHHIGMPQPTAK